MSTTKEKILEASRKLLNQKGLSAVSQRTIATHLNMSPGNLTYHFKKRSEIVEALYFQLVHHIDIAILNIPQGEGLLMGMHHLTKVIMQQFFDYRFIMLDFIQVMREFPGIKKHYTQLLAQREEQFNGLMQLLVQQGFLRKEQLPNEYQNLIKRLGITTDFWLAHAEFHAEKISTDQIEQYLNITSQAIYPYLTAKGRKSYSKIKQESL